MTNGWQINTGYRAIDQKVVGSSPTTTKLLLLPWARPLTIDCSKWCSIVIKTLRCCQFLKKGYILQYHELTSVLLLLALQYCLHSSYYLLDWITYTLKTYFNTSESTLFRLGRFRKCDSLLGVCRSHWLDNYCCFWK